MKTSLSSPAAGRGISEGASGAASKVSSPKTRTLTRVPAALRAMVLTSSTGLADATAGSWTTRSNSRSGMAEPRSVRSGSPLVARTALENSAKAELLIRCTE